MQQVELADLVLAFDEFRRENRTTSDDSSWAPLENFLPLSWCSGFMFMGHNLTDNGRRVWLYKHGVTRRYLVLDRDSVPWKIDEAGSWVPQDPIEAVLDAYAGITALGAPDGQAGPETPYDQAYKEWRDRGLEKAGYTVLKVDLSD